QSAVDLSARRSRERVDKRGFETLPLVWGMLENVDGFVEREGAVHLHMRLADRRPRADRVKGTDKRERETLQVVTRAGDGEADLLLRQPHIADGLLDHVHQHPDLGAR